ncbi:sulfotransferase domain-containing protein [Sediminibacterium ginsengisoli]|uniref:Sulfotransferase domain-containing protein n=1 Tax=Sediminibacterium ginsengisoli TaxID=413434 RepID=A0A1T4L6J2_9BACT|nr:sulfotransferase domain-containing protein [Sediminibacterium ginsengisoli]SJZ50217.1 Sulfotransferase domain-containing protein [Sediminibacterium ginsengisoli]
MRIDVAKKIVWLASYPKSGNTWFRMFLSALLKNDGAFNINTPEIQGIFSSRALFEQFTDFDSGYLYRHEVLQLLPEVFTEFANLNQSSEKLFLKVHDAYILNEKGLPIIPAAPTRCAVYFIRNPLDIVASFSNHMGKSFDQMILTMNNPMAFLASQKNNLNNESQFPQLLLSWSEHVLSWKYVTQFPVLIIRYEDMLADTLATFSRITDFIGLQASQQEINKALATTSFHQLKQQESTAGFNEINPSRSFFRQGQAGKWVDELTKEQANLIISTHGTVMQQYGYPSSLIME